MKGGSLAKAMSAPFTRPRPRPVSRAAGIPSMPHSGIRDPRIATMAAAARIEPTDRSMPPVRMTKVIPAARTVLIEACCITIERFWKLRNRPDMSSNTMPRMMSTGSMPMACRVDRQARRR
jgi:hypothetical protein